MTVDQSGAAAAADSYTACGLDSDIPVSTAHYTVQLLNLITALALDCRLFLTPLPPSPPQLVVVMGFEVA